MADPGVVARFPESGGASDAEWLDGAPLFFVRISSFPKDKIAGQAQFHCLHLELPADAANLCNCVLDTKRAGLIAPVWRISRNAVRQYFSFSCAGAFLT